MAEARQVRLTVNGVVREGLVEPRMTLADFRSYIDAHARAEDVWRDPQAWTRMSIFNTAASGIFSTDRTIEK